MEFCSNNHTQEAVTFPPPVAGEYLCCLIYFCLLICECFYKCCLYVKNGPRNSRLTTASSIKHFKSGLKGGLNTLPEKDGFFSCLKCIICNCRDERFCFLK